MHIDIHNAGQLAVERDIFPSFTTITLTEDENRAVLYFEDEKELKAFVEKINEL